MAVRSTSARRWRIAVLLGILLAVVGGYAYLTRPARLRAKLLELCRTLPSAEITVDDIRYTPWRGLEISAAEAARAWRDGGAPEAGRGALPPLLRVGSARVRCDWRTLLSGHVRATEIELHDVALSLLVGPAGGETKFPAGQAESWARQIAHLVGGLDDRAPRVTIEGADLQLLSLERGQPRLLQRWLLRVTGGPTEGGYELRLEHRPRQERALAEVTWSRKTRELALALDWVDASTLVQSVPSRAAQVLRNLEADGRVRLDQLVLSAPHDHLRLDRAVVRVDELRFVAPIEQPALDPAGGASRARNPDTFLRLTDGNATLRYQRGDAAAGDTQIEMNGRLRGAPTFLSLTTTLDALRRAGALTQDDAPEATGFTLDDIGQAELRVTELEAPTHEAFPAFVTAPGLSGPIASVFRDYRPHGKINLALRIRPPQTPPCSPAERLEGEIEPQGASCRYFRFPYAFDDVRGVVRLARGRVQYEGLRGRHGTAVVQVDGALAHTRSWTGFDLAFRGQDVALDGDLYAALPDHYRRLWETTAPRGMSDVVVTLTRPEGTPESAAEPTDLQVDAHLMDASLALGDGRRIERAEGWLSIRGGTVELTNLHGYDGQAAVRLDGTLRVDDPGYTDVQVEVRDQPVTHAANWPADPPDAPPAIRFSGTADVWGQVRGAQQGSHRTQSFAAHLTHGTLTGRDPTRPWTLTDGWVGVRDARYELISLECRQGEARLRASGALPSAGTPARPVQLRLNATTPQLEALYPQFVPRAWMDLADAFGLGGAADVTVVLHPDGDDPNSVAQAADIDVQASHMRPRPMPLDLRSVLARATLSAGHFRVSSAAAEYGPNGRIELSQAHDADWGAAGLDADFGLAATRIVLDPQFVAGMPGPLARLLNRVAARGEFDAVLPTVHVTGNEHEQHAWSLEGVLALRGVSGRIGYELTGLDGSLSGTCRLNPDGGVDLDARIAIERAAIAGRPIAQCEGRLVHDAADRWVRLDHLHGRLCDGVIQGSLAVDPETAEYELAVRLYDISAAQLFPPPPSNPERQRRGRLAGDIWLRGHEGEPSSRRGGGAVRVTGASFVQMPVLASILLLRPTENVQDTVDQAQVRFLWDGQEVRLEWIDIRSPDLRLVGEGQWNLANDSLRATLLAAHPDHWPRLGLLSDLVESAGRELVQYRVSGTLASPKVTAQPLRKLDEAVRRLLGEE